MSRAEPLCRVFKKKIIAFGGSAVSRFMNEGQRNVYLWASQGSGLSQDLLIVAGFYVTNVFPRNFESLEVYKWLDFIYPIEESRAQSHVYRILRIEEDPRLHGIPAQSAWLNFDWMLREDEVGQEGFVGGQCSFKPGHFIIVLVPKGLRDRIAWLGEHYKPYLGELEPMLISRSVTTGALTGTGTGGSSRSSGSSGSAGSSQSRSRDKSTVSQARLRDGGCVVTKQYAKIRARGYAYEGVEVAHIYPLAFAPEFIKAFPDQSHPIYKELDIDVNQITDESLRKALDCAKNCIVLRADLHALFDMYQFSFKKNGDRWYMVRFERGARPFQKDINAQIWMESQRPTTKAPSTPGGDPEQIPMPLEAIDDPCEALLEYHYLTAVSWHVAGAGTTPLDNAILVQSKINPGGPLLSSY